MAHHLGLREFVDNYVDLRNAPGRAGGDYSDDANASRTGGTEQVLGRDKHRWKYWHQAVSTGDGAGPTLRTR